MADTSTRLSKYYLKIQQGLAHRQNARRVGLSVARTTEQP
jgi:hypothetical protein